jgi:Cu(I)/Ag(I) efflux system membrane protein CusA/SilA
MTASAVLASLVPILWHIGRRHEAIAAPIVGGMVTFTGHVLILVPVLFLWLKQWALKHGRLGSSGALQG